ncbi:peptide ABC transporter substrate-binding protein [Microbulbifer guangxiensis]|uniref:peptide ABC transporter substrate-binding protein n=1 Tax=Microbulbifer guangxiensis TaxID=2904249 RepID=UPI001F3F804A|nr:peptide ABC transporter substrate-binding protein [Microbulbifer guangxiensis]
MVRSIDGEPETLDPHLSAGVVEWNVLVDLFEGLVEIDWDGDIKPAVARDWSSVDGQTYLFNLREDAHWCNGDPVTAHDFVFSWRRLVDPQTASKYASYLTTAGVLNAAKVSSGAMPTEALGIEAVSNTTLRVQLERPSYMFPAMLDHFAVFPVHAATLKAHGEQWSRPGIHIGNGAYCLEERVLREKIELRRNPHYWDADATRIERVTHLSMPSSASDLQRYLAGEVDITYDLPPDRVKDLSESVKGAIHAEVLPLAARYYNIYTQRPPFNDPRVRRALAYAIDRRVIAQRIYGRGERPAFSLIPLDDLPDIDSAGHWSSWAQSERESRARQLLKEAGFSAEAPLHVRLLHSDKDLSKREAVAVASMWKRVLGAEVELQQNEWKAFVDLQASGNYDVSITGWWADYYEPSSLLRPLSSRDSYNHPRYANERFDRILERALTEQDAQKRAKLYTDAELLLAQDMPVIPVFHYAVSRLVNPRVGGYRAHVLDTIRSKHLWIESPQDM